MRKYVLTVVLILSGIFNSAVSMAAFTGGDYWVTGMQQHGPTLSAVRFYAVGSITATYPAAPINAGDMLPPDPTAYDILIHDAVDGPAYQSQLRARTVREIQWAMRAHLNAPDATGNGTGIVYSPGMHRHMMQFGDDNFSNNMALTYSITPDNRITLNDASGGVVNGVFSTDYEFLLISSTSDLYGINMGVKVASGVSSLPVARYSWSGFMLEINRDDTVSADGENGNERLTGYFTNNIGLIDLVSLPGNFIMHNIQGRLQVDDPDTTSPVLGTVTADEGGSGPVAGLLSAFVDGAGLVGPQMDSWMAVSQSGEFLLMASAADYDLRFSDASVGGTAPTYANQYRHNQSWTTALQLAPVGTHNLASLAGTYAMTGIWDQHDTGSGSYDAGLSVGEISLLADGTGTFNFQNTNHIGVTGTSSGGINWSIVPTCIGVDTATMTRLPYASPTCVADGGQMVDMVVITAGGSTVAWMFVSASGQVLNYFDPNGLEVAGANSISKGIAVRLP